jgi:hypothetical protein
VISPPLLTLGSVYDRLLRFLPLWGALTIAVSLVINTARRHAARMGNTPAAIQRRADYASLLQDLNLLAQRSGKRELVLPAPEGLYWIYRHLEYGRSPELGGTYLFTDLPAIAPSFGMSLQVRPRGEIAPQTLRIIATIPRLQRVFDPSPPAQ